MSAKKTAAPSIDGTPAAEILRRLEISVTRRLDGLLQGDHRGLTPGHGSEPGEIRAYQPGDDVRRIDWNVTARLGETHVRDSVADRELETWMLVDASASLAFGTATCEKRDLALAGVAATGFLTARTGNRIGAMTIGPNGASPPIPARSGRAHGREKSGEDLFNGESLCKRFVGRHNTVTQHIGSDVEDVLR